MARSDIRTDKTWTAFDIVALLVLLGLLLVLWWLWLTGRGPDRAACATGAATAAVMAPAVPLVATPSTTPRLPAALELQSAGGKLRLLGRVESETAKSTIGDSAMTVYGTGNVTNSLTVDSAVAPAGWIGKAKDLIEGVKSWGPVAQLRLDGNAATLAGAVTAAAEKTARGETLAALLGPDAAIDNRMFVVAPPPVAAAKLPASVDVRVLDTGVRLSGRVNSEAAKSALGKAADTVFGAGNVANDLAADEGVDVLRWQSKAAEVLGELKIAGPGKALIATGVSATLAGVVASDAAKAEPEKALARIFGSDATLDNRLAVMTPPSASAPAEPAPQAPEPMPVPVANVPASVDLQSADGKLKLLGRVDAEAARTAFGAAGSAVFGDANVTNELGIDKMTLPVGWQGKARDVLAQLKSWGSVGVIHADGNAITLAGTAPSLEEKQARGDAVKQMLGANVAVDNRIVVVAPPVAAAAEPAPAAPEFTCLSITRGVKIGFETASSLLDATGRRALDDVITCLVNNTYDVTGHTDTVGTTDFNDVLSLRRAESVVKYLKGRGVAADLRSKGAGSSQPVATNATPEGRAQNRRIEFKPL